LGVIAVILWPLEGGNVIEYDNSKRE